MPCGKMRSFVGWLFLGKQQSLFPMIYDSAIQVFHGDIWQLFAMFLSMTILVWIWQCCWGILEKELPQLQPQLTVILQSLQA